MKSPGRLRDVVTIKYFEACFSIRKHARNLTISFVYHKQRHHTKHHSVCSTCQHRFAACCSNHHSCKGQLLTNFTAVLKSQEWQLYEMQRTQHSFTCITPNILTMPRQCLDRVLYS